MPEDKISENNKHTTHHPVFKHIDEESLYLGKVLNMKKYYFKDDQGNERSWEGVEKIKNKERDVISNEDENLCTIGILRRQIMCDALILVKQYRAQLKAYTIEFPAKMLKNNEDPLESANQEIEDDTGYTSTDVKYVTPLTSTDPIISTSKVRIVSMLIDGDDPLQNPSPRNSISEYEENDGHGTIIEVLKVPINGLLDRLNRFSAEGYIVDSLVYAFAIGLKKGEQISIKSAINDQAETY